MDFNRIISNYIKFAFAYLFIHCFVGPAGPFSHRCSALGPGALCTVLRGNKSSVFYIILYKCYVNVIDSILNLIDFILKCNKFVDL